MSDAAVATTSRNDIRPCVVYGCESKEQCYKWPKQPSLAPQWTRFVKQKVCCGGEEE